MGNTEIKEVEASEIKQEDLNAMQKFKDFKASQQKKNVATATGRTGTGLIVGFVDSNEPYLKITCKDRHEFDRLYDQMKRFKDKHDHDNITITGSRRNLLLELFNDILMEKLDKEMKSASKQR
jgi:hypothetical protein